MSYHRTICEAVPCSWVLVAGKTQEIYCSVLNQLFVLLDYAWMPDFCVCNFEKALINVLKNENWDFSGDIFIFDKQYKTCKNLQLFLIKVPSAMNLSKS
ncbi:LOW QUALITY PROTEIN: hypothetical protein MXB_3320 [Myxobolus squamalis]|nr:LOW QUALITY PROTEIN: hypothetical protein MXB_3320 [Myxobolus squamalis]